MKRIGCLIILIIAISISALGQGRTFQGGRVPITATTAWDSIHIGTNCHYLAISNDAASGTDTLFLANGNDTLSANLFPIYQGETITIPDFGFKAFIRLKTSANTIKSRHLAY